jgi:site-specific DNA-cytosine methylase
LLENVQSVKATWNKVVSQFDKIGYDAAWVFCDTKDYYLPQTRERMYMIAIERKTFGKYAAEAAARWKTLMKELKRPCSSPYEAWIPASLQAPSSYPKLLSEVDWPLCKLRYDHIRSEEKLGILSPITRRRDNGTIRYVPYVTSLLLVAPIQR